VKGYRLFDVYKKKVILSRDVIFNESETGYACDIRNDTQSECVEIIWENISEQESDDADSLVDVADNSSNTERRYPARERKVPDFFGNRVAVADDVTEPSTVSEALNDIDSVKWKLAMQNEMEIMSRNNVGSSLLCQLIKML
jgi:hypothetical protein